MPESSVTGESKLHSQVNDFSAAKDFHRDFFSLFEGIDSFTNRANVMRTFANRVLNLQNDVTTDPQIFTQDFDFDVSAFESSFISE